MTEILGLLKRPLNAIGDALDLWRLQRRLPFAYRRLISVSGEMRAERDAEYLERLRDIDDERSG